MQILVFTKGGGKVPNIPTRSGLRSQHIQFETTLLDELLLIAKYRIINFPTSLIIDNKGKVLLKVRGSIPSSYVQNFAPNN